MKNSFPLPFAFMIGLQAEVVDWAAEGCSQGYCLMNELKHLDTLCSATDGIYAENANKRLILRNSAQQGADSRLRF
jgi:hypothetical protein